MLSVLSLSAYFLSVLLLFMRATFCVIVSFQLYVSSLLVILVKLLARKTPPRKPLYGKEIYLHRAQPEEYSQLFPFCVLFHCPRPYTIYFILLWCDIACLC